MAGLAVIVVARLAIPTAPPLYDGIVPLEPYVWLDPPPGQPGGAQGATAEIAVRNRKSPLVAVATPELEPQAQIFAPPGGLTVPAGAHTIKVSIQPVPTEGTTTDGHVDGNVYRISVTDEAGSPLTAPASALVSVVLRATDPAQAEATIARRSGGSWQPIKTSPSGFGGSLLAVVTEFGDFAVIIPGEGPSASPTDVPPSSATSEASAVRHTPAPSAATPPNEPPGSPDRSLIALAGLGIGVVVLTAVLVRRRRRGRYRGAHPMRRR